VTKQTGVRERLRAALDLATHGRNNPMRYIGESTLADITVAKLVLGAGGDPYIGMLTVRDVFRPVEGLAVESCAL
jgi:hypothetical protein